MLYLALFFAGMAGGDPVRTMEAQTMASAAQTRAYDQHKQESLSESKREFEQKFNKLIDALEDFSKEYKSSDGQTWPAQKANRLKAAMREFEKSLPNEKKPAKLKEPAVTDSGDQTAGVADRTAVEHD